MSHQTEENNPERPGVISLVRSRVTCLFVDIQHLGTHVLVDELPASLIEFICTSDINQFHIEFVLIFVVHEKDTVWF